MLTCYSDATMRTENGPPSLPTTHTFIIRIWREQRELPSEVDEWRGVVEHVPSGQRWYVLRAKQVAQVLAPYWGQPSSPSWWARLKMHLISCLGRLTS